MQETKIKEILRNTYRYSDADETEILLIGGKNSLTRFANNIIHQNVAEENYRISVRTNYNGKTARATTNRFDRDSLKQVVRRAKELSLIQEKNPDLAPMPKKQTYQPVHDYFPATEKCTPGKRAQSVKMITDRADREGLSVAGIFSTGVQVTAIGNSHGLFAFHRGTSANFSITATAPDSSGYSNEFSPDVDELDIEKFGKTAIEKARLSAQPKEIPVKKYVAILEPLAVTEFLIFLIEHFRGRGILDGDSFLYNKMGQKIFGDNITIQDNVYHPLQSGLPFDYEGEARKNVELVEKGIVKNVVYSRQTARAANRLGQKKKKPTGHGFPVPNTTGEMPMNIVMTGGSSTTEKLIASTDQGILLSRTWYNRLVDPMDVLVTGMTRDGTFWIENGKIKHGIRNFRFNQSLISMLQNVLAMAPTQRATGDEFGTNVVPALKVNNFNFTEGTRF